MVSIINLTGTSSDEDAVTSTRRSTGGAGPSRPRNSPSRATRSTRPTRSSNSQFTNLMTFERVPKSQGILLSSKWYNVHAMAKWLNTGARTVPHSRERLTAQQVQEITRRAAAAAAGTAAGTAAQPPPPLGAPPVEGAHVFLRRTMTRGYKYYKLAFWGNPGSWRRRVSRWQRNAWVSIYVSVTAAQGDWARLVLPSRGQAPMHVSMDFNDRGEGHWETIAEPNGQGGMWTTWGRVHRRGFARALQNRLPLAMNGLAA